MTVIHYTLDTMKLIVQIPCYNEEETLPLVVDSIPREIEGIDTVETMIIDDGSSDRTIEVAKELGVDHIVQQNRNKGLAKNFYAGLQESLRLGADIVVNTDGDNQYPQERIPELIQPIMDGTHDIVVADRQTHTIEHFSPLKKFLQGLGSRIVNKASNTYLPDAVSGFRAYSREAAMNLNVVTDFSYCTETIIAAGKKRMAITHIPVETNPKTRESRLFKNIWSHVYKSMMTILKSYTMYKPLKIFVLSGLLALLIGILPFIRFLYLTLVFGDPVSGHIQSLIFGSVFVVIAFILFVLGVVADLIAINRQLLEDILHRLRRAEYDNQHPDKKQ